MTKTAATTDPIAIRRRPVMFLCGACAPDSALIQSTFRCFCSVRWRIQRHDLEPGEDLLVDDEREGEQVQGGHRRNGAPYLPLLAGRALVGNPALHRRHPEQDQREADSPDLIKALVEHRVAVTLRPIEGMESVEQRQMEDDHAPDQVGQLLQLLPVRPELPLRRRVGREQDRHRYENDEEPGHQEGVPGEPAEDPARETGRDGSCGPVRDTDEREEDAVPPPERRIPPCSGQRDKRSYRDSYQESGLAARPQHVGFGKRQHVLGVQRQPPAQDEEPRDERGKAQEEQRDRPPLETGQRRGLLGHPVVNRTPLSFLPRLFFVMLRIKSFLVVVVRVGSLRVRGILVGSLLVCALIGTTGVRAFRIRILLLDRVPLAHFSCLLLPFQSSGLWRVSTAPPGPASQVCFVWAFYLACLGGAGAPGWPGNWLSVRPVSDAPAPFSRKMKKRPPCSTI